MKRFFTLVMLVCFITQMTGIRPAQADKVDILIQKLIDKGILEKDEAFGLKLEMAEEEKEERVKKAALPDPIPDWVKSTKLAGDLRIRYENIDKEGSLDRQRGRYRLRLSTDTKINDKLNMYFGIASGSTANPRSTNQSFTDSSDKKSIIFDLAYAKYAATPWLTVLGGKMKNPLWEPGDLVWDTDITPEGGAIQFSKKVTSMIDFFTNAGVFVIDEISTSTDDPTQFTVQPGINVKLGKATWKTAVAYNNFYNVKEASLDNNSGSNTYITGTTLKNNYVNIFPTTEITIKKPFEAFGFNLPMLAFFGEYIENTEIEKNESGYMAGVKFGSEKIADWKDWQFKYNFARLEKDAVVDILPDSDRYTGKTGIKAHEAAIDFGVGKNTWLSFDYYYSEALAANTAELPEHLWQLDWNMKF